MNQSGPILDIGGMGAFSKGIFFEKRIFYLLAPPKQMCSANIEKNNNHTQLMCKI